MKGLNIGSHELPLNSATKTFAVLAKRGAGKTYAGGVLAEEFFKVGVPFVIFDPIDCWWGLRFKQVGENKDGTPILEKGVPIVVFGLEHADIQIDKNMGKQIAQAIVKNNISCVISTFGMPKSAQKHLIAEFSEELLNINNTPRHIFIEEAHEFIPQRVLGDMGKVFNAVSNLIVMGRNRGLGVTILNQRAATVNKDVLTQIDTLIALRSVGPQDRDALREWVEEHSAEGDFEAFLKSLPSLPTGEGWVWSPEFLGIFEKIKIRKRETFHPDREKLGMKFQMPQMEQVDIQDFIKGFEIMKAKEDVPAEKQKAKGQSQSESPIEPKVDRSEIIALRNEYESKLLQKDQELRQLNQLLAQVRNLLGVNGGGATSSVPPAQNSNLQLWIEKLGPNSAEARVLKLMSERPSNAFTRQQLALAVGIGYDHLRKNVIGKLKRTLLIKEADGKLSLSPDL